MNRSSPRFQRWLAGQGQRHGLHVLPPPERPDEPAVVLQAIAALLDPAVAFPVRLVVDGLRVTAVPWGWSVHPLPLGDHELELFHRAGWIMRAPPARVGLTLDENQPVLHVLYKATPILFARGRVRVEPYLGNPAP